MRVCLLEDDLVTDLEPLTLTRPAYDLLLGSGSIGEKIFRAFGVGKSSSRRGALVRPELAPLQRERDPFTSVNDRDWLARGPVLVVNARWVPPAGFQAPEVDRPRIGLCDGLPACAWVGPGQAVGLDLHGAGAWFDEMQSGIKPFDVGGEWVRRPWDLLAMNPDHLVRDFFVETKAGPRPRQLSDVALVGPADLLCVHETARVDPYTVFDTTGGPITVASGAWVQPFTRIEGPSFVGRDSQLFRANLRGGVTVGPVCRIGGEVEASIVHGYSNKYHEGFLGHSYVGEWVNLGAITSNSDLRNDYGEVQVPLSGDPVPTGRRKVGCFIGDHTRTGMASMFNTGTSVGVMCNVLPAGPLLPKFVPSFSAVLQGRVAPGFALDRMLETARTVKSRRGQNLTEVEREFFLDLYERTRADRERAVEHARRSDRWHVASHA